MITWTRNYLFNTDGNDTRIIYTGSADVVARILMTGHL